MRTYNSLGTGTGSELSQDTFDGDSDAVATNATGAELAWDLLPHLTLSGRVGYLWATAQDLENQPTANPCAVCLRDRAGTRRTDLEGRDRLNGGRNIPHGFLHYRQPTAGLEAFSDAGGQHMLSQGSLLPLRTQKAAGAESIAIAPQTAQRHYRARIKSRITWSTTPSQPSWPWVRL